MHKDTRYYNTAFLLFMAIIFIVFHSEHSIAQSVYDHDTLYYKTYPKNVTARLFFSQKYTNLKIESNTGDKELNYQPNTTFNLGIGATYRAFTLNLAYGFRILNPDEGKGETRYLDLQFHFYPRKWSFDGFSQNYYGYYLTPKGFLSGSPDLYYLRPDIKVNLLGAALYRVMNDRRFSYKATMIQSEWQKKSAGSLLLGAEFYYGSVRADSALVPSEVANFYDQLRVNKFTFIELGPGVGYAYTLVLPSYFFITGSLTLNPSFSVVREIAGEGLLTNVIIDPNIFFRFAAGYSNNKWNASLTWLNNEVSATGEGNSYSLSTGNYRIIVARRITPNKNSKKILRKIDKIFE